MEAKKTLHSRAILGGKPVFDKDNKNKQPQFRVYGMAHGAILEDKGQYDPYYVLRGQFRAVNFDTGEEFASGRCILPTGVNELLASQLDSEDVHGLNFGFDIGIRACKGGETSPTGYVWYADAVLESEEADPLKVIQEKLPKLPAPKAAQAAK